MQKFTITKPDSHKVPCISEFPEKPCGIVIAIHGFTSSKECSTYQMLLRRLPAAGFGMIGIDLPGHGKEEAAQEELRIQAALDSIQAAEEYAVHHYPGLPICYFASSFGAYLTSLYLSTRMHRGRKAFFRSAAVNMPSLFVKENPTEKERQQLAELQEKGYFFSEMEGNPPVRITRAMYHDLEVTDLFAVFGPDRFGKHQIAMAHGAEDEVIDPEAAKRFSRQFHIPLTVFQGEGHSLSLKPETPDQVADLAIELYRSPLGPEEGYKREAERKVREDAPDQAAKEAVSCDIICVGMALVDSIIKGFDPNPVSASGYRAASGSLNVGGEAVNEAMAAAKLGMKTGILCSLGEDDAGDMVTEALKKCGVETSFIVRSKEHPTPVTTMFVAEDGTRKSITNGSHRYNFHPEQYLSCLSGARAIILGSLFRAPFDDPEIIRAVLQEAKKRGILVVADTKLPNFRFLNLDDIASCLPLIDTITPNEDEARYFSGKDEPEEMADEFLKRGVKNVIIKLGGKGCLFKNKDVSVRLPAFSIRAVDATGAGDNFVAGYTAEILNGNDPVKALRFAGACGAICTTAVGAGTALKSREQVLEFLKQQG